MRYHARGRRQSKLCLLPRAWYLNPEKTEMFKLFDTEVLHQCPLASCLLRGSCLLLLIQEVYHSFVSASTRLWHNAGSPSVMAQSCVWYVWWYRYREASDQCLWWSGVIWYLLGVVCVAGFFVLGAVFFLLGEISELKL